MSATHKETKQFFTLYNTLDDKKVYLEKEVNCFSDVLDGHKEYYNNLADDSWYSNLRISTCFLSWFKFNKSLFFLIKLQVPTTEKKFEACVFSACVVKSQEPASYVC